MTSLREGGLGQFAGETDIGAAGAPGSCAYDAARQAYAVSGAGANIWGERDGLHLVWRRIAGDFIVTAQAALAGDSVHPHRKLGWMARASLEPDAPHVSAAVHADGLVALQYRRAPGAATEERRSSAAGADVVQLERRGDTFIMSTAHFGEPLVPVEVSELAVGAELYVGLFVCSHEEGVVERATFHNVRLVVPAGPGFDRGRDPFASLLEVMEVATGHRRVLLTADDVLEAPNWTRDGAALIYNSGGRLIRYDLASGESAPIDTGDVTRNNNDHVISFDGATLAISSSPPGDYVSHVYTVPITGGQPKLITPRGPSYLHGWSPDGRFLVYTALRDGDFDVFRIPSAGGEEERLTTAVGLDDGPEYTPDGAFIYFNSVRTGLMQIWRMLPDGGGEEQLTDDEYNNWFPHISPDGQQVIFLSYLVGEVTPSDHPAAKRCYLRLMPRDGGAPRVVAYLYGGQGTMNVPSWSPDGRFVAFVTNTVPLGT